MQLHTLRWNLVIGVYDALLGNFCDLNRTINILCLWCRKFNNSSFLSMAHEALSEALFYQKVFMHGHETLLRAFSSDFRQRTKFRKIFGWQTIS